MKLETAYPLDDVCLSTPQSLAPGWTHVILLESTQRLVETGHPEKMVCSIVIS